MSLQDKKLEKQLEKKLIKTAQQLTRLANKEISELSKEQHSWNTRYINNHVPKVGMTGKTSVTLAPGRYGGVGTRSNTYKNLN